MIVRTRKNGNVLELEDETADILIRNKIYEEASDAEKKTHRQKVSDAESGKPPKSDTAVAPLTTADVPQKPKRGGRKTA